ncbi:MAG TPA: hypothetical protein VF529_03180 [Solirubrobacteraceae bacterium]|jgi:hypothetical protein
MRLAVLAALLATATALSALAVIPARDAPPALRLAASADRGVARRCPAALPPGRHPEAAVAAAARRHFPDRKIRGLLSLGPGSYGTFPVFHSMARQGCDDNRLVARSWVVFTLGTLRAPSLTEGVHFFARTRRGWVDWFDAR